MAKKLNTSNYIFRVNITVGNANGTDRICAENQLVGGNVKDVNCTSTSGLVGQYVTVYLPLGITMALCKIDVYGYCKSCFVFPSFREEFCL